MLPYLRDSCVWLQLTASHMAIRFPLVGAVCVCFLIVASLSPSGIASGALTGTLNATDRSGEAHTSSVTLSEQGECSLAYGLDGLPRVVLYCCGYYIWHTPIDAGVVAAASDWAC